MPAPAKSLANMRAWPYEVMWKAETIGYCKDVDPSGLELLTRDQTVEELHDLIVDQWIYGVQGTIKLIAQESLAARLRQLMPWAAATNAFSVSPTVVNGYSMYANAQPLIIHPRGVGDATEDFQFAKAFPIIKLPKSAGGKRWNELSVEFRIFHDQAALTAVSPTVVAGYVGALPA